MKGLESGSKQKVKKKKLFSVWKKYEWVKGKIPLFVCLSVSSLSPYLSLPSHPLSLLKRIQIRNTKFSDTPCPKPPQEASMFLSDPKVKRWTLKRYSPRQNLICLVVLEIYAGCRMVEELEDGWKIVERFLSNLREKLWWFILKMAKKLKRHGEIRKLRGGIVKIFINWTWECGEWGVTISGQISN